MPQCRTESLRVKRYCSDLAVGFGGGVASGAPTSVAAAPAASAAAAAAAPPAPKEEKPQVCASSFPCAIHASTAQSCSFAGGHQTKIF
jgi:hypothetical protein